MKTCLVVPHFDHVEEFRGLLPKLAALGHHLVVVDDASPAAAFTALARLLDEGGHDVTLIRHPENLGKGGAVTSGLRAAHNAGFSHAVQIDADGQHDHRDVPVLCAAAAANQDSLICGEPAFGKDISALRYYARFITLYLTWFETLSRTIRDPMCGLRVYPLRPVVGLLNRSRLPTRMAFDPEILVRAVWGGIPLEFVEVHVRYPKGGRSHFRYLGDNLEIAWMHTRLLGGMLTRIPRLVVSPGTRHSRRSEATSRHWARHREAGLIAGMRILVWIHNHGGRAAFSVALLPVMAYFFMRRGDARRASREFFMRVRRCYPEALGRRSTTWMSFRQFITFGQSLLDKYLAWVQPPAGITMDPDQEKMLFDAVASGKGCMLIGSHFGNLEYSRGIAHRHPTLIINVLMYDKHARKFAGLLEHSAPESRMNLIQVTDLDFALALRLKERVQNGEWVVIAGDRIPVSGGERVCDAVFFGEIAKFPVGPYVLASLLQCPVYLLHCFRDADRYRLVMEFFTEEVRLPRANRQLAFETNAQKFATALEQQVSRAPLQWFNFFDFWSEGDPSDDAPTGAGN